MRLTYGILFRYPKPLKFVSSYNLFQGYNLSLFPATNTNTRVGFEVLTAVVMNVAIFWDIAPCDLLALWFLA
jgi:hypothetical protein